MMIRGTQIYKSFDDTEVLKGIDVTVEPGKISVVVGPSGSGKSTLLRALSLIDPPTRGGVSIDDREYVFPSVNGQKIAAPWPHVSVVFQQLFLWPHMTLRQNIMLPMQNLNGTYDGEQLESLIDLLGMSSFIDHFPNETSAGQRQRAALVRAMVLKPRYILIDEITSALDVEQVSKVLALLQDLRKDGVGIFMITHLLGFARRAADNILFLSDGVVLESGGRELLNDPREERVRQFISVIESAS